MSLSTEQQMLIEQRVANDKKSVGIAYLLWILFGTLGAHRFYAGKSGSGLVVLILWVGGFLFMLAASSFGAVMMIAAAIWLLLDLFAIPSLITAHTNALRSKIALELSASN